MCNRKKYFPLFLYHNNSTFVYMDYCTLYNMKAIMRTSIIRLETRRFYLKVKGFFKGICLLICDCFYYLLQNVLGVTVKKQF